MTHFARLVLTCFLFSVLGLSQSVAQNEIADPRDEVPADTTPEAVSPLTWESLKGNWKNIYWDSHFGAVRGDVKIDENQNISLAITHPETGEQTNLTLESASIDGNTLNATFTGASPHSPRQTGLNYPEEAIVIDTPDLTQIRIIGGTDDIVQPVKALEESDSERVELILEKLSDTALAGNWRYRVNPFLQRAKDGYGRAGELEQDDNGVWWSTGSETWTQPKPQIFGIMPIQDQLAKEVFSDGATLPYYGYPFGPDADGNGRMRTLFVFGRDLPKDWSQKIEIKGGTPGITYNEIARLSDYERREERRANVRRESADEDRRMDDFNRGRQLLKNRSEPDKHAKIEELEAVILRANLDADVVPGWQSVNYGGSESAWLLQFGDNTARLRIVRKIGRQDSEHESTGYLFTGELFRIEIETTHKLPVKSIPVTVGAAPLGVSMDAWSEGGLLVGDGEGIPAMRSPENPKIYRTEFIRVDPRMPVGKVGSANAARPYHIISGKQGTRVFAKIARPGLISLPPTMAQATVYDTAGDTGVGGNWNTWLTKAASCAGVENVSRLATERATADTITEYVINSGRARFPIPGWFDSKVTVGQHAGMVLMRDTFVRQLERNRATFQSLQSDEDIIAFRRAMAPVILQERSPLSRIEVKGMDGIPTTFNWTFKEAVIGDVYDKKIEDVERWAIEATREALATYTRLMDEQSRKTRAIDDCDVEELLKTTGYRFEAVAALASSKLMVPAAAPIYWAPDYRARANVETVAYVAEQVEIFEKLGEADRREALMAIGLATIPVAVVGGMAGSGAAIFATFAVDVIDIGFATYKEVDEKWARDAEVQFALAAADVTGMRRLERAESRARNWSAVMGALFPQVTFAAMGALVDVPDLYKVYREGFRIFKVQRGRKVLMEANNIASAADTAPARSAQVAEELEDSLERSRLAQAAGESSDAPPLRAPDAAAQLDPEIEAALRPAQRGVRFDELPDALTSSADDIFSYLDDIGSSAHLSDIDDLFLTSAQRIARDIGEGTEAPPWVSAFRSETLEELRRIFNERRPDLAELMETGAQRVARQLEAADPIRRRFAREVLESEPGLSPERFEALVEELVKRNPTPRSPDYYSQANPNRLDLTDDLADAGWRFTLEETGQSAAYLIRDPDGRVGSVQRAFDPETGVFKMEAAFREAAGAPANTLPGPIRGMIENVLPVGLTPRGVPAIQYATMRLMNHFGIAYGSTGAGAIKQAMMEHIANYATIVKLEYLRRTYHPSKALSELPEEELSRLLMMTHSVRYAQSVLANAGYRIKSAKIELDALGGDGVMRFFHRNFYSQTESAAEFAARHGIKGDDEGLTFFNIILDVEPF